MSQGSTNTNIDTQQVQLIDSGANDAFGRARVSQPVTLFDTATLYDEDSLQLEAITSGQGQAPVHNANTRLVNLTVNSGGSGGTSALQSYRYTVYQPGRSHVIVATAVIGAAVANANKRIGYYDANNGVFFEQNGTTDIQWCVRSSTSGSVVDTNVTQSNWNIDKLDGTGASGITLDITKAQIFIIDLQWLGMGRVRTGFEIDGKIIYCHEFLNANTTLTTPYMQTATLPVRAEVTSTVALGSNTTMHFNCANVSTECGALTLFGFEFTTTGSVTAASGADTHILSLRPKTTFNSIENRTNFILESFAVLVTGNNPVELTVSVGSTFSVAPTYGDVDTTNSAFEAGTGGTLTATGIEILKQYIPATNSVKGALTSPTTLRYPISLDAAGAVRANGTLSFHVAGIGGLSATQIACNWIEQR